MPNGTIVRVTGASGNNPTIGFSDPATFDTAIPTIGWTTEAIQNNQLGYVTYSGLIRLLDTSAFVPQTILWLDDNGTFSAQRQEAPRFDIALGIVLIQHQNQGLVLSTIVRAQRLVALSDVHIVGTPEHGSLLYWNNTESRWQSDMPSAPSDGDMLYWNDTAGRWESGPPPA
jgi:hypothetical protein